MVGAPGDELAQVQGVGIAGQAAIAGEERGERVLLDVGEDGIDKSRPRLSAWWACGTSRSGRDPEAGTTRSQLRLRAPTVARSVAIGGRGRRSCRTALPPTMRRRPKTPHTTRCPGISRPRKLPSPSAQIRGTPTGARIGRSRRDESRGASQLTPERHWSRRALLGAACRRQKPTKRRGRSFLLSLCIRYSSLVPGRPKSHVIADKALSAVTSIFTKAGHAVERVANDYGEDLLVQTAHAGRMDASRLWVQVKGTTTIGRRRTTGGWLRFDFARDVVLRWIRSADSVLVVLWDVEAEEGWFSYPDQVDPFGTEVRKTVTLRFQDEDRFSDESVSRLVWRSRLQHYNTLYLRARDTDDNRAEDSEQPYQSVSSLIALDLLCLLDLAEDRGDKCAVTASAHARFLNAVGTLFQRAEAEQHGDAESSPDDIAALVHGAAILTILAAAQRLTHGGTPRAILRGCTDVFMLLAGGTAALAEVFGGESFSQDFVPPEFRSN